MSCRISRPLSLLAVLAGLALSAVALAEEPKMPPMTAEQQAAMDAMTKAMTPGPQHRHLTEAVGTWEFKGRFWSEPGAPPSESSGTSERTMLLGGRVLMEKLTSEFMGMPFEGMGLTGFDNVTGRYWSTWNDNMSTGVMMMSGTCDAEGSHCRFEGSYSDPVSGKSKTMRMESERVSADREVGRSYEAGPDGKERLTMELAYTRRK